MSEEVIQPISEPLSDIALQQFAEYCEPKERGTDLRRFLLYSLGWNKENIPREVLTNNWNVPFFRGLYPELQDDDVYGYRVLTKLDGDSWLTLNELSQISLAPYDDWQEDWLTTLAHEQINGRPLPSDIRPDESKTPHLVVDRVEHGMSRQLRMISAMVMTRSIQKGLPDKNIEDFREKVPAYDDVLQLSDAELATAEGLLRASR